MRMYKTAQDELDSIGDFDTPENNYETYPELYPKLKGKPKTHPQLTRVKVPWSHFCYE